MSARGKILLGLALVLFVCLGAWVIRTTPDTPPPLEKVEPPKTMSYSGNVLSEERDGKRLWDLTAERTEVNVETQDAEMENLLGHFYLQDGRTIEIRAKHGLYENKTKDIHLDGEVLGTTSDGAELSAEKLDWLSEAGMLVAEGKARIQKDDMLAEGDRMESADAFRHFWIRGNAHIVKGVEPGQGTQQGTAAQ